MILVGHNPGMSEVIQSICGANVNLKTGAIARIDLYPPALRGATLRWLLSPRVLDAIAKYNMITAQEYASCRCCPGCHPALRVPTRTSWSTCICRGNSYSILS